MIIYGHIMKSNESREFIRCILDCKAIAFRRLAVLLVVHLHRNFQVRSPRGMKVDFAWQGSLDKVQRRLIDKAMDFEDRVMLFEDMEQHSLTGIYKKSFVKYFEGLCMF